MKALVNRDGPAKVDLAIAKSAPFAQPIMHHLRSLIHKAIPGVEEAVKWGRPFFLHRGVILCFMASFQEHCSFGFWGPGMAAVLKQDGVETSGSSGSFGRIASVKDLLPDKVLLGYLRQAAALAQDGTGTAKAAHLRRVQKSELQAPPELLAAINNEDGAATAFATLNPSCRREYIEWVLAAKRPETRERRIAKTIEQVCKGKSLSWKYEGRSSEPDYSKSRYRPES